ncbi:YkgJ family cysteine cluster protein [Geomonas sp. RF6]|uniref:YkgJ family cysteine cluster protein n=1 Tax=Geomonas sp. RF6 TaxID=2897342 RepID=UPI001E600CA4|nr:YkgJ family cysteine cluster protein [Geomonas sp. RF6]UFS68837.1 YkgJ family cysteine cluster protein [Geomonas sp. RF6]
MSGLENYRVLVARVDEMCATTATKFAAHLACRPGCDACCRHLTIFAVEAAALRRALEELPPSQQEQIRELAKVSTAHGRCPLLHDGLCLLYEARPIICRTHGLPLLVKRGDDSEIDFCPENFAGVESIPGSAVIDLERLNALLAAINALYLKGCPGPERITMAQALSE